MNYAQWIYQLKRSETPWARSLKASYKWARGLSLTFPQPIGILLFRSWQFIRNLLSELTRQLWWTPLFKGRLLECGQGLYLYSGLPYIADPLEIHIGKQCRISGQTTFTGRSLSTPTPKLIVGDNVDIGWQTTIAVGRTVTIGNNVRIAGRALLAGYPGHPLDPTRRAQGHPCDDYQARDITLADDVWLATGVTVMAGVTIGAGTIVAAGSVVTKDLPAGVLAGGTPAQVIRPIDADEA